jgi:hypothetical protein
MTKGTNEDTIKTEGTILKNPKKKSPWGSNDGGWVPPYMSMQPEAQSPGTRHSFFGPAQARHDPTRFMPGPARPNKPGHA